MSRTANPPARQSQYLKMLDPSFLKRSSLSPMEILCAAGFLLLFPGFFFYHTLIGLGLMPAILGGFFRPMALLFLAGVICVTLFGAKSTSGQTSLVGSLYFCILGWTVLVAIWHYLIGSQVDNMDLLDWSISGVFLNVTCYLVARHLPLEWPIFNTVVMVFLVIMILLVFTLAKDGMFHIRAEGRADDEKISTYQGFGLSLATTALFAMALTRQTLGSMAISLLSIAALYVNGARSEFVCMIAAFLICWSVVAVAARGNGLPLLALISLVALLPFASFEVVQTVIPENRILELLDLGGSTSAIERAELSRAGWREIVENPVFGNYGFYYDSGGVGSYPHNISAAWVNLGIIGILGYIVLFCLLIIMQILMWQTNLLTGQLRVAGLLFLTFTVIALLFAKEYTYMLTAFAVAFTDRVWSGWKNESTRTL